MTTDAIQEAEAFFPVSLVVSCKLFSGGEFFFILAGHQTKTTSTESTLLLESRPAHFKIPYLWKQVLQRSTTIPQTPEIVSLYFHLVEFDFKISYNSIIYWQLGSFHQEQEKAVGIL